MSTSVLQMPGQSPQGLPGAPKPRGRCRRALPGQLASTLLYLSLVSAALLPIAFAARDELDFHGSDLLSGEEIPSYSRRVSYDLNRFVSEVSRRMHVGLNRSYDIARHEADQYQMYRRELRQGFELFTRNTGRLKAALGKEHLGKLAQIRCALKLDCRDSAAASPPAAEEVRYSDGPEAELRREGGRRAGHWRRDGDRGELEAEAMAERLFADDPIDGRRTSRDDPVAFIGTGGGSSLAAEDTAGRPPAPSPWSDAAAKADAATALAMSDATLAAREFAGTEAMDDTVEGAEAAEILGPEAA